MLDKVKSAGITGAGGAGFPAHIKLGAKARSYIINAAECEPLLATDRTLMLNFSKEIIEGIKAVREITPYEKAYIGIKEKNRDCGEALKKFIDVDFIEVRVLRNVYPSGDEQVMIYEILDKVVPEAGIPLDIDVIVNNVETVYRIGKAVLQDEPFSKRFVSIIGEVNNPQVREVPVGTSFSYLLDIAGKKDIDYVAIDGGPMMGKVVEVNEGFVRKTTSGIIFLERDHPLIRRKTQTIKSVVSQARASCCNCMTCTELCSRYLLGHRMEPHKIMRAIGMELTQPHVYEHAMLCSECNICELYACPIGLSPRAVNVKIKNDMRKEGKRFEKERLPEYKAPVFRKGRQINTTRLTARLGLSKYYSVKPEYITGELKPDMLRIYLNQHIGAPAKAVVEVGNEIKANQLVGKLDGDFSANVHSPLDGKVIDKDENYIDIEVIL